MPASRGEPRHSEPSGPHPAHLRRPFATWWTRRRPHIACADPARRVQALRALQTFRDDYRSAWVRFACGCRQAVFPAGTVWMRRHLGVRCREPAAGG